MVNLLGLYFWKRIFSVLLVDFFLANSMAAPLTQASGALVGSDCLPQWSVDQVVAPPGRGGRFFDVSAYSADDVWAVGARGDVVDADALIQHWNGRKWQRVPIPRERGWSALKAVTAIAPDNAWAVGYTQYNFPLVLHWDGVEWSDVTETIISPADYFTAIEGISADDIWIGGTTGHKVVLMHWDGGAWKSFEPPEAGEISVNDFAAIHANDVWAVNAPFINVFNPGKTSILHYDGTEWKSVSSPNVGERQNWLNAIAGASSDDVWAVGHYTKHNWDFAPLVLHWDGFEWRVHKLGKAFDGVGRLKEILVLATNSVWAFGDNQNAIHWNGVKWSRVQLAPTDVQVITWGATAISETEMWLAGAQTVKTEHPSIRRYGPPITAANLVSPPNNSVETEVQVKLKWNKATCAVRYELELRENSKNGAAVEQLTDIPRARYKTSTLTPDTNYFWRVRGCNADGCGTWSNWSKFSIAP